MFLLVSIIIFNLTTKIVFSNSENQSNELLSSRKFNEKSFQNAIESLLKQKDIQKAKILINLAKSKTQNQAYLLEKIDEIYLIEHKEEIENILINKWRLVIGEYPKYRDGYVQIAKYYHEKKDIKNLNKILEIIEKINPNWEDLNKLKRL